MPTLVELKEKAKRLCPYPVGAWTDAQFDLFSQYADSAFAKYKGHKTTVFVIVWPRARVGHCGHRRGQQGSLLSPKPIGSLRRTGSWNTREAMMEGWMDIELQLEDGVCLGDVVPCIVDGEDHEAEIVAIGPLSFAARIRVRGLDVEESYAPADLFGEAGIPIHINCDGRAVTSLKRR